MPHPIVLAVILLLTAACHPGFEHAAYSSIRDNPPVLRDGGDSGGGTTPAPSFPLPNFTSTGAGVTGGLHEQDGFTPAITPAAPTEFRHDYHITLDCIGGFCNGEKLTGTAVLIVNTMRQEINLDSIDASSADLAFHLFGMLETQLEPETEGDFSAELTHSESSGVWTFEPVATSILSGFDESMPGTMPGTIEFEIQSANDRAVIISGLAVPGDQLQ